MTLDNFDLLALHAVQGIVSGAESPSYVPHMV